MNWKYEAMDKLRCYEAKKGSIERSTQEIRRLEDEMTRIRSATTDSTPVTGGGCTREDAMVNNIAHREELKLAIRDARQWVNMVDSGLSVLDDQELRVLDLFFIHRVKGNLDRLCGEMGVEKTAVYDRRDKALRHFTLALYGVMET